MFFAVCHYVGPAPPPRTVGEVQVILGSGALAPHYGKVATVDCETMDEAYAYTQNIDHPWVENPTILNNGINNFDPDINGRNELASLRSTDVGDIIVHMLELYMVDSVGFTPLSATRRPRRSGRRFRSI